MKINQKKLKDIAQAFGVILGYIAILIGVILTVLILRTLYTGT